MVEAADEVLAGDEVDAGLAAKRGVDLREQRSRDTDVANAAHIDGGEEAGEVADDTASEGEQDGVAVGPGVDQLLGKGFDLSHALVALAGGMEEDEWVLSFWKAGKEALVPERPYLRRGDDE